MTRYVTTIILYSICSQLFAEQCDDSKTDQTKCPQINMATVAAILETSDADYESVTTKENSAVTDEPTKPEQNTTNKIDGNKWLPSPSPWILWVTVFVALGTFVLRLYNYIVERRDKSRDRKISIEDEFWYRGVILPTCLEPLLQFVLVQSDKLHNLNNRFLNSDENKNAEYKTYLDQFQKEKRSLENRSIVLEVISEEAYASVTKELDDLEDAVTTHCAFNSLGTNPVDGKSYDKFTVTEERFFIFLRDVYKTLVQEHGNIFPVRQ